MLTCRPRVCLFAANYDMNVKHKSASVYIYIDFHEAVLCNIDRYMAKEAVVCVGSMECY